MRLPNTRTFAVSPRYSANKKCQLIASNKGTKTIKIEAMVTPAAVLIGSGELFVDILGLQRRGGAVRCLQRIAVYNSKHLTLDGTWKGLGTLVHTARDTLHCWSPNSGTFVSTYIIVYNRVTQSLSVHSQSTFKVFNNAAESAERIAARQKMASNKWGGPDSCPLYTPLSWDALIRLLQNFRGVSGRSYACRKIWTDTSH